MKIFKCFALGLLLVTTGCATLSREECLYGDWTGLGIKDGRDGNEASRFINHQDACRQYGIIPDKRQYLAGREQGLQNYCQLENAIETGLRGNRYQSVCPAAIHNTFQRYNDAAYWVYQKRGELKSLSNSISSKENALLDKKLTDKNRHAIRDEIRNMDTKRQQLRDDLYSAERQLDRLMEDARKYHW